MNEPDWRWKLASCEKDRAMEEASSISGEIQPAQLASIDTIVMGGIRLRITTLSFDALKEIVSRAILPLPIFFERCSVNSPSSTVVGAIYAISGSADLDRLEVEAVLDRMLALNTQFRSSLALMGAISVDKGYVKYSSAEEALYIRDALNLTGCAPLS